MKKFPRAAAVAGITVLAVGMLASGCSSGSADAGGHSDGTTVLKVYGWKGSESEPANVAEINAAFQKANPDITLKYEVVPANEAYAQRVQPELLGGTAADVIMVDSNFLNTWASSGYLADQSSQSWASVIAPGIKGFASYDGKIMAMPMEVSGVGLFANMDLLGKVGITAVPTDWPSFLEALGKLKAAGINPITLPNKGGWEGSVALLDSAATLTDASWDQSFYEGDASFSEWIPAVNQLLELQSKGYLDWSTEMGKDEWSQGIADFESGKAAFWVQGAWNLSAVQQKGMNVQFAAWPGGAEGTTPNGLLFMGTMWAVNDASKAKDAAERYIDFWSKSENLGKYLEAESAINPFTNGTTPENSATTVFNQANSDGNIRYMQVNTWMAGDVQTQLGQELQKVLLGTATPEQFADQMDKIGKRAS